MNTVSSSFSAFPARNSALLCELAKHQNFRFWRTCEERHCANQIIWLLYLGPFLWIQESRLTLCWNSPSSHPVISLLSQLRIVPRRHCVGRRRVTREASLNMLSPIGNLCNQFRNACHRFSWRAEALFAPGLLVFGHQGFTIGRPTPALGLRIRQFSSECHNWNKVRRLAYYTFFYNSSMMETQK